MMPDLYFTFLQFTSLTCIEELTSAHNALVMANGGAENERFKSMDVAIERLSQEARGSSVRLKVAQIASRSI